MEISLSIIAAITAFLVSAFISVLFKKGLTRVETNITKSNLPSPNYKNFINREQERKEIINNLLDENKPNIISIEGIGGIGKTALAINIAYEVLQKNYFYAILYIDASKSKFTSDGEIKFDIPNDIQQILISTLEAILNISVPTDKGVNYQYLSINNSILNKKILIIIDNIELVEYKEKLYYFLHGISHKTKILLTSRQHLPECYSMQLTPLSESSSTALIKSITTEFNSYLNDEQIQSLSQLTSGSPLAIQLSTSLLSNGYSIESLPEKITTNTTEYSKYILGNILTQLNTMKELPILFAIISLKGKASKHEIASLLKITANEVEESAINLIRNNIVTFEEPNYYTNQVIIDLMAHSQDYLNFVNNLDVE